MQVFKLSYKAKITYLKGIDIKIKNRKKTYVKAYKTIYSENMFNDIGFTI